MPRLRNASLRLRGGTDGESADALRDIRRRRAETDGDEEDANGMKAAAKRRAEQARRAGSFSSSESLSKTAYRILASATNKIGLTVRARSADLQLALTLTRLHSLAADCVCGQGSSTRVVNGQVVVRRNVVQKLFHMIYIFFRAIYFFCKTLVVPLSTLEPQNKGGSRPRRGSFASMSKSNVVRMADLPPMPGG